MKPFVLASLLALFTISGIHAQIEYRELPAEWEKLVLGGNFMDRILPMPNGESSKNIWGAQGVKDRYIDNGVEDNTISYWGGNIIKGDDGKYHFFLCGWREDNPDGHMGYKNYSKNFHAVANNTIGPFTVKEELGKGHNTEIFQLNDGRYCLYYVTGNDYKEHCNYAISNSLNGPWKEYVLPLDLRDREVRIGGGNWFHNMSFTKREDGSVLMLSRCGSIWVSKTGTSPYHLITTKSIYPMVSGKYEDPVIWKDHIQYNAIVNDWIGRTAFYMRSKDGIHWVTEAGRAYVPSVAVHKDRKKEDWYKYERIRIYQDEYGRAIQANFAVIDANKHDDLSKDNHSSKNIGMPLNPGMLLVLEHETPFTRKTKEIKVRIKGEENFNPNLEVDVMSLRFGAASQVNFGRGAKLIKSEAEGQDLVVIFEAKNHFIDEEVFAPKMIGKNKKGDLLFGYTRLPWMNYNEAIISARKPVYKDGKLMVVVENHGQVASKATMLTLNTYNKSGVEEEVAQEMVPVIEPYGSVALEIKSDSTFSTTKAYPVIVKILSRTGKPIRFRTIISK